MKTKKILIGIFITIIILIVGGTCIYNFSLKPQVPVVPVDKQVTIDPLTMAKKFFPKDVNLSLEEISAESNTTFTANEITDLFIASINEMPDAKQYITGLKVTLDNNLINLFLDLKYKGIPLGAKLTFSCSAIDGKGIFHFEKGNIGFIDISKDTIFNNLTDTSVIQFDKSKGNIILSFETIKALNVKNMEVKDNSLIINFKGTIKFWDWLKN